MQKARVGPSYSCCLQVYAIAVFLFYDAANEKPCFTCEVKAGDIRGIDVENPHVPIYIWHSSRTDRLLWLCSSD